MVINKENYSKVLIILVAVIFFMVLHPITTRAEELDKKHVLVINSYDSKNRWTNEIMNGIISILGSDDSMDIRVEYMDTKHICDEEYFAKLYDIYKYKYSKSRFDVIISTDNDAFDFLKKYRDTLFPEVPVVFCGVNNYDYSMLKGTKLYTGVAEILNVKDTINLALTNFPMTKNVIVFTDQSSTGLGNMKLIKEELDKRGNNLNSTYVERSSISSAKRFVKNISSNSIILVTGAFTDDKGEYISMEEGTDELSRSCNIPIYGFWDFQLNHGVVGGVMTTGDYQGKEAGKKALEVLSGIKPDDIVIDNSMPTQYIVDYKKLKEYNVNMDSIPRNGRIINKPTYFYSISKRTVELIALAVTSSLCIFIAFLLINNTKRKKAEKALRESEERLRTLIEATPDIICFKDGEGKLLEANEALLRLLGVYGTDFRGKKESELIANNSVNISDVFRREKEENITWQIGKVIRSEETVAQGNGGYMILDLLKIPLFNKDGSRKALIILGRDITEHKNSERMKKRAEEDERLLRELREYDKIKTEFFANISHELRTPLNVIFSAIQLIELIERKGHIEESMDKLNEYIKVMKQNSYRLVRIVNNLIDITKMDAGYLELELQNNDIVSIVEDITISVREYVESKGIDLIFDTDIEEKIIACDPDKIERIVLNLLSNAVKFTSHGGNILVNIKDTGERIIIEVKDDGIGIPEEKQHCIFERFVQVDKSLSRNREGSGIGLSLVKSLVELHGGNISLKSKLGEGSTFIIELPVETIPDSAVVIKEDLCIGNSNIERINIEFSDIYA
ncbi:MAG: ABC transporter substrate binding protein [Bacillota bacterium]|nr:ABC transporter substrate binding protein [Bacillota bacterium]